MAVWLKLSNLLLGTSEKGQRHPVPVPVSKGAMAPISERLKMSQVCEIAKCENENIQNCEQESCNGNEGVIDGDLAAIIERTETVLPSPFFSAVIAIICAAILLIM